jgi:hypothetical protein
MHNHQDAKRTKLHQAMQTQVLTRFVPFYVLGVLVVKGFFQ